MVSCCHQLQLVQPHGQQHQQQGMFRDWTALGSVRWQGLLPLEPLWPVR